MSDFTIIVDACCNHKGKYNIAKKMIKKAKENGANYIKFQKRDIDTWSKHKPLVYNSEHPDKKNSFGKTYEKHRRNLEFDISIHKKLKEQCDLVGIGYCCSVFDIKSAKQIIELKPQMIKIPSACNTNFKLLDYICDNYNGDIHISLGMTSKTEVDKIINFFIKKRKNKKLVLYACTSAYPLMPSDVCLYEIQELKRKYLHVVKDIGYSGHHSGIDIDLVAYSFGANYIERHFTINKNYKGTDHKLSITPLELKELVKKLSIIKLCLKHKGNDILDSEISNKEKLKW